MERVVVRASTKKAMLISIAWQSKHIVVAGGTDSIIRVFDIRKGTLIRAMSLGQVQGGPKEIFVWAVKVLPDGTIISGDSAGELRIWDGTTYTLMQRIKSHRQDILSLAVSADGASIFSGGMDRRTTVYKQTGERGRSRWAEVSHRRYHTHDVKAMATYEGKGLSVVVSGGPDATPVVVPLAGFGSVFSYHPIALKLTYLQTREPARFIIPTTPTDRQIRATEKTRHELVGKRSAHIPPRQDESTNRNSRLRKRK